MTDLDAREEDVDAILRASGQRLLAAMSQSPIAEFQRPRGVHRRSWIIAIAAVVVLVVGLVAIGTNRNDESLGNDPARLRWLVTDLPEGLRLVQVSDPGSQTGAPGAITMLNVYATDAAPLGPILSVRGNAGRPELEIVPAASGTNFQETTIDGHRAAFADGETGGTRLLFIELSGHWVLMTSRNIDDAALSLMAQSVIRNEDGTALIPAAGLLDGLTLMLSADAPIDDLGLAVSFAGVSYAKPDGRSIELQVFTPRLSSRALLGLGAALTPTKVAGADGFEGSYSIESSVPPINVHLLSWQRDGLGFLVMGLNVTETEVMAAAESAEPASDAKWNEMLRQVGGGLDSGAVPEGTAPAAGTVPAEPAPPGTDPPFIGDVRDVSVEITVTNPSANQQVWSGTLPTGETWKVDVTRVFDSIAMKPKINGSERGMSYGPLVRAAGQELGCCGPLSVITADPTATALRVTTNTGERFAIQLHDLPGTDGLRIAVIALPSGGGPQAAELIDEDSNVLEALPGG
jgi:hypothetical protein